MLLKEKGKLITDEKQLASIINKSFINITKNLNLKEDQGSPPVILKESLVSYFLKNFFFTRVLARSQKPMKAVKSFISKK